MPHGGIAPRADLCATQLTQTPPETLPQLCEIVYSGISLVGFFFFFFPSLFF